MSSDLVLYNCNAICLSVRPVSVLFWLQYLVFLAGQLMDVWGERGGGGQRTKNLSCPGVRIPGVSPSHSSCRATCREEAEIIVKPCLMTLCKVWAFSFQFAVLQMIYFVRMLSFSYSGGLINSFYTHIFGFPLLSCFMDEWWMMTRQCPINIVRPVKMIVCLLSAVRPSSSFYQQSIERKQKNKR